MSETRTHLSLFSGIGGIDIAAYQAGFTTTAFCEQDAFCQAVLRKNFGNDSLIFDDARTVTARALWERGTDWPFLVSGGFPCQNVSIAGKKEGLGTETAPSHRSGLWYAMLRVIRDCRPRYVLIENVANLVNQGMDVVLGGLEQEGYTCWSGIMGADAVGAPHRRNRIFIVGYCPGNDGNGWGNAGEWAAAGVAHVRGDTRRCGRARGARGRSGPEPADGYSYAAERGLGCSSLAQGVRQRRASERGGEPNEECSTDTTGASSDGNRDCHENGTDETLADADGGGEQQSERLFPKGRRRVGNSGEDVAHTDSAGQREQREPESAPTAHTAAERGGVCRPGDSAGTELADAQCVESRERPDADVFRGRTNPAQQVGLAGSNDGSPAPFMADVSGVGHERGGESWNRGRQPVYGGFWPSRPGQPQHEWESPRTVPSTRSQLGLAVDGISRDVVRRAGRLRRLAIKSAGNAVVPAQIYPVLRAIADHAEAQEEGGA